MGERADKRHVLLDQLFASLEISLLAVAAKERGEATDVIGREEVREEAERLQLDGFLVKPVTKSMIVDTLVNVFADEGEAASVTTEGGQAMRLRGARILLTEDNDINQQIAVELLECTGRNLPIRPAVRRRSRQGRVGHLSRSRPPRNDVGVRRLDRP